MSDKLQTEMESKAIGAILYDARNLDECLIAGVQSEDFTCFPFPGAYQAAVNLCEANDTVSVINIVGRMALNGNAKAILVQLSQLADEAGPHWSIKDIIREIRRTATQRRVIASARLIADQVKDASHWTETEILDFTEKQLLNLRGQTNPQKVITAEQMMEQVQEQIDSFGRGVTPGITTGLERLDSITGGIKYGQLWIIAARPSMGKSSLLSQIVEHTSVDKAIPVGIFSMEMSHLEWGHNMLHSKARINNRRAQEQKLETAEYALLAMSASAIGKAPFEICTQAELSIHQLRSIARQMKRRMGAKLFAVDYLQLASSKTKYGEGREREIAQVSNGLKAMAKELDAGVIVACQLNRMAEEGGKPKMSWLRESGQIEADGDFIGVIYQPEPKDHRNLSLYILKQRTGPRFIDIPIHFKKEWTRFEQIQNETP